MKNIIKDNKIIKKLYFNKVDKYSLTSINEVLNRVKYHYECVNKDRLNYLFNHLIFLKKDNEYLHKMENYLEYVKTSNSSEDLINKKIEDLEFTLEIENNIKYLQQQDRTLAYKQYSKVKYLEHYNKHKKSIFITLTCPSEYHYFTKTKGKNKKVKFDTLGESIEGSFEFQKSINRELYKQFKKYLERKGLNGDFDYIRMLETHNRDFNLTIHSHSILYLEDNQIPILKKVFENLVKRHNLKQTKLEILTIAKSSSYVMKYIIKNFNREDNFYNEMKRYYSTHRFFTTSNFKNTTQAEINKVYNHLKNDRPKLFKKFKNLKVPLYVNIEKYILKYLDINYKITPQKIVKLDHTKEVIEYVIEEHKKVLLPLGLFDIKVIYENLLYSSTNSKTQQIIEIMNIEKDISTKFILVKTLQEIKYKPKFIKKLKVKKYIFEIYTPRATPQKKDLNFIYNQLHY